MEKMATNDKLTKNLIRFNFLLGSVIVVLLGVYLVATNTNKNININALPSTNNTEATSGEYADFAKIQDCLSDTTWDNVNQCYDNFVKNFAQGKTVKQVLAAMESARSQSTSLENGCHPIAHAIGRYTLGQYKNVGDAFDQCDYSCHSGCYHGVMERMFYSDEQLAKGTAHLSYKDLASKIPNICSKDKFSNPSRQIIFQCLHGVGHAILYSLDYKLDEALKLCDLLPTVYDQSSCYGGVIMENVTAFDKGKRWIKKEEPLYPCTALDEKYRDSCYSMQTSVMFEQGLSIDQISAECAKTGKFRGTCYRSLGRDLSNRVRVNNVSEVVSACETKSDIYTRECVRGVIYALVDNTWNGQYAFKYCSSLNNNENQRACFEDVGYYMKGAHEKSLDQIRSDCDQYSGNKADLCKEEAGV